MNTTENQAVPVLEIFWRPGCGYCARLRDDLSRRGVAATWRNIWDDSSAAEIVRGINEGNETVPTVRLGSHTLTNPNGAEVADLLEHARG